MGEAHPLMMASTTQSPREWLMAILLVKFSTRTIIMMRQRSVPTHGSNSCRAKACQHRSHVCFVCATASLVRPSIKHVLSLQILWFVTGVSRNCRRIVVLWELRRLLSVALWLFNFRTLGLWHASHYKATIVRRSSWVFIYF